MTNISPQIKTNRRFYIKILLDILLTAIWTVLMVYPLTGAFWHEWIGLFAIGLIIIHNLLNLSWIIRMTKKILTSRFTMSSFKYIISFLLLLLMLFSGISGILIAKKIAFPIYASDYSLWVYLHHLSSYLLIILISIHIGVHGKMLLSVCRKTFKIKSDSRARSIILKILALAIMIWGMKASVEYKIPLPDDSDGENVHKTKTFKSNTSQPVKTETSGETEVKQGTESTGKDPSEEEETQPADDTTNQAAALEEFLSNLYCTGCHRHCSLLAPQCVTGDIQAESAIVEFEETYQNEAGTVSAETETLVLETFSAGNESTEDRASLMEIAPIMSFWILGAHYAVRLVDYGRSDSRKKKKED